MTAVAANRASRSAMKRHGPCVAATIVSSDCVAQTGWSLSTVQIAWRTAFAIVIGGTAVRATSDEKIWGF
jgi:hypothetical protein